MKLSNKYKTVLFYGHILRVKNDASYLVADATGEIFSYTSRPAYKDEGLHWRGEGSSRLCTIQDHIHDDLEQLAANASEAELPCNPFVPRPGVHFRVGMNRDGYLIGTETYRPATVVSDTGVIMNKFEPSWVRTEDLEVK